MAEAALLAPLAAYLERTWGPTDLAVFLGVVNAASAASAAFTMIVLYALSGDIDYLYVGKGERETKAEAGERQTARRSHNSPAHGLDRVERQAARRSHSSPAHVPDRVERLAARRSHSSPAHVPCRVERQAARRSYSSSPQPPAPFA